MNLKRKISLKKEERLYYEDPSASTKLCDSIYNWIPSKGSDVIILCIGTDRSTGDSLGPLTGTLLAERNCSNISVYGTLDQPIHATNLCDRLSEINRIHNRPFIIAIDACLGKMRSIGSIHTAIGPIQPGKALKKDLPSVGDLHISGVVNVSGYMEFFVLQNTRLHIVMQMAKKIANGLTLLDRKIGYYPDPFIQNSLT